MGVPKFFCFIEGGLDKKRRFLEFFTQSPPPLISNEGVPNQGLSSPAPGEVEGVGGGGNMRDPGKEVGIIGQG